MTHVATATTSAKSGAKFRQELHVRLETLSYLPTTTAVAMKFIELGKNPDAEPVDYARIISADTSLSSKILALANSSWAGVREKVTNVRTAVNLMGLGTVRTLTISYCMTGLHNELRLSSEESQMFWEMSLGKAVAAKKYAKLTETKKADEAFVAGLFQDFAMPVMYATAKEEVLQILQNPEIDTPTQLQMERDLFGMDHADVGRALAQRLELPDLFVDAIAFHHRYDKLTELIKHETITNAIYVASLFPHILNGRHPEDAKTLGAFLEKHTSSADEYIAQVQDEFEKMYGFFHDGAIPETKLAELLERATCEVADNTTKLVGKVNEMMREAASTGFNVNKLVSKLENQSSRDALTGVLNRAGFDAQAKETLAKAARYGIGYSVVFLDIDKFKRINDGFNHEFGDATLTTVTDIITAAVSKEDLIGRMGGDEFVLLLNDCTKKDAKQIVQRIIADVAATPIRQHNQSTQLTLSAGLVYVRPSNEQQQVKDLVSAADKLMYRAKRAGGNQVEVATIPA